MAQQRWALAGCAGAGTDVGPPWGVWARSLDLQAQQVSTCCCSHLLSFSQHADPAVVVSPLKKKNKAKKEEHGLEGKGSKARGRTRSKARSKAGGGAADHVTPDPAVFEAASAESQRWSHAQPPSRLAQPLADPSQPLPLPSRPIQPLPPSSRRVQPLARACPPPRPFRRDGEDSGGGAAAPARARWRRVGGLPGERRRAGLRPQHRQQRKVRLGRARGTAAPSERESERVLTSRPRRVVITATCRS